MKNLGANLGPNCRCHAHFEISYWDACDVSIVVRMIAKAETVLNALSSWERGRPVRRPQLKIFLD